MSRGLLTTWGGDRARPQLVHAHVLLGSDPEMLYVIGERKGPIAIEDAVVLETWSAATGVRISTSMVARCGQLRARSVWRASDGDAVVIAVRGFERCELALLDPGTGALWGEVYVPFGLHVTSSSRDASVHVVCDADGRDAEVSWPGVRSRPGEALGAKTYAVSGDGVLVACWNEETQRLLVFERSSSTAVAWNDERYAFQAPQMVFADDRSTLWCASLGEVRCFALPSLTELGRWTGASRVAEIVAVDRTGQAALLDGPVAFALGHGPPVPPRDYAWSPHLGRLSPDGHRLAHASGVLGWYDLASDRRVELHSGGHAGTVLSIAVSRDGRRVATSSTDRSIRVCEAVTGQCHWVLEGDAEGLEAMTFAPDGRTLYAATCGFEPRLTSWSIEDGTETTPAPLGLSGAMGLEVSDDGARLVTAIVADDLAQGVTLVDLSSFRARDVERTDSETTPQGPSARGPRRARAAGAFLRGGRSARVVVGSTRSRTWTLDAGTGAEEEGDGRLDSFLDDEELVLGLSRDGRWLWTSMSRDGYLDLRVLDAEDGMRATFLARRIVRGPATAWTVGAGVAVIAGADGEPIVVRPAERSVRSLVWTPLRTRVTALALSPDGKVLYLGTESGQVRLYDLSAG